MAAQNECEQDTANSPPEVTSPPELTPEKSAVKCSLPGLTNLVVHTAQLGGQSNKMFGAEETYELEEILGEGSYGSVYRCSRIRDGSTYAVKIIDPVRLGFVGGEHAIKTAEAMAVREVNALRQLASHPTVISLEAAFYSTGTRQIYIVSDYVPGGHLFSHVLSRPNPLQEEEVSHVVAQVSDALRFCHSLGLVHRDLKLENVLVASIDMTLQQTKDPDTGLTMWQTREVFAVKICDFGFAKSLKKFTTRTPIGTASYSAPEVKLVSNDEMREGLQEEDAEYDAFKADAYSVGLMTFVMLCLAFPDKDGSHRLNKKWPTLSASAQSLIDGLLEFDPLKRFSLINVCQHNWVNFIKVEVSGHSQPKNDRQTSTLSFLDEDHDYAPTRQTSVGIQRCVKNPVLRGSFVADNVDPRTDHGFARQTTVVHVSDFLERDADNGLARQTTVGIPRCVDDPVLRGVLALHRALVHVQQERSMALWALAGSPGEGVISCSRDQLQWHIELTEKRVHEAKKMLEQGQSMDERVHLDKTFQQLASSLRAGRQLSLSVVPLGMTDRPSGCMSLDSFDVAFAAYNDACRSIIEKVAQCVETAKLGSPEGLRASRQYRLFSSAAEQLSRERAFMCGQSQSHSAASCGAEELPSAMMQRLFEIIGARKILLGTVNKGSYTVATSTGILDTLIGEGQPTLLGTSDLAELESLEARVLAPTKGEALPIACWYRTLTRLLNEIHMKISIGLARDLRSPESGSRTSGICEALSPKGTPCRRLSDKDSLEARPNLLRMTSIGSATPLGPVEENFVCFVCQKTRWQPNSMEEVEESIEVAVIGGKQKRDSYSCKAGLRLVLLQLLDRLGQ